ncbi:MAG: CoA transferase, partial [Gammaproteobacteria bacterium]|nr:CoA transferase [Gammaproteobacteria bacterium]
NANYEVKRLGNAIESGAPFNTYLCKDGKYIYIHGVLDAHWQVICRIMGREELIDDPRTATMHARPENIDFVDEVVGAWTATLNVEEAWKLLETGGVAAGPVMDFPEIIDFPHYRERDSVVEIEHPNHGRLTTYGVGTKYSRTPASIKGPAPGLGEHNRAVYCEELGLSEERLAELKEAGVV